MFSDSLLLPRPRLVEKALETINDCGLTVVTAPMGYGKTTLAWSMAEHAADQTYYYVTPAGPHEAGFLWYDLFDRLEASGLAAAPALRRLGFPETVSQWRKVLECFRGLQARTNLIIDDYHLITDPAWSDFWEKIIRAGPPNFRLVLFSRTRPGLRLEEMRLKGLAAVFEQDFLAFSAAETREFFQINGLSDETQAVEAQSYSEGWAAALWLCLQNRLAGGRSGPPPDIESLLAHTVFAAYDPGERDFLMSLSVLEYFTEADAARLASVPQTSARLRTLREKNAFLTYDPASGRHQFHAIFRDFLRRELDRSGHIDKPALYRQAGESRAESGELVAAGRLLRRAGRDEDLVRLLDLFPRIEEDGGVIYFAEEIFSVTEALPWPLRLRNPLGYLAFIWYFNDIWRDHRTVTLLEEAEDRFQAAPEIPPYLKKRLQGEIEVLRASLVFNDSEQCLVHFERAVRLLDGPSFICAKDSVWNYGSPSLVFIGLRGPGQYPAMIATNERVLNLYHTLSGGRARGGETVLHGEYFLERGDLTRAEPLLMKAWRECGPDDRYLAGALSSGFNLARLSIAAGRPERVGPILDQLRERTARLGLIDLTEGLDLAEGYLNGVLGRAESIPQWLRDGDISDPPHGSLPHIFGFGLTVHAKALLLAGDYQRLAQAAEDLPQAAPIKCFLAEIHGRVLGAIAAWPLKGRAAALTLLSQSLELTRPDGLLLPVAEYGRHILPLLRYLKRSRPGDDHLEATLDLAGRIARITARPGGGRSNSGLSPRETELMRHVAAGKSNPAIAALVGISRDTVKEILGQAYRKLRAAGRLEASRRFVEMYDTKREDES